MKVKEIAKLFGMNVDTLVSISGYSKQGFFDVIKNKCNRDNKRFNEFIELMQFISMHIFAEDKAEARIQYNIRKKLLKQLVKKERAGGNNDD